MNEDALINAKNSLKAQAGCSPFAGIAHLHAARIMLDDLPAELGRKDVRTAVEWCRKHNVPVFGSGGQRWVSALDVAVELDSDLIAHLIGKYGEENWFIAYKKYLGNDMEGMVRLKFAPTVQQLRKKTRPAVTNKGEKDGFIDRFI